MNGVFENVLDRVGSSVMMFQCFRRVFLILFVVEEYVVRKTRGHGCLGVEGLLVESVEVGLGLGLGVAVVVVVGGGVVVVGVAVVGGGVVVVEMEERVLWIRSFGYPLWLRCLVKFEIVFR